MGNKVIQVVIDEELLDRIDKVAEIKTQQKINKAKKRGLSASQLARVGKCSRSQVICELCEEGIKWSGYNI